MPDRLKELEKARVIELKTRWGMHKPDRSREHFYLVSTRREVFWFYVNDWDYAEFERSSRTGVVDCRELTVSDMAEIFSTKDYAVPVPEQLLEVLADLVGKSCASWEEKLTTMRSQHALLIGDHERFHAAAQVPRKPHGFEF